MLLPPLSFSQLRLTFCCEQDLRLPRWKGATLRGGWGRALRGVFCAAECAEPTTCERACPYRTLFTPEAPDSRQKGVREAPRPFVVRPPLDERTHYQAGDHVAFELICIGLTQQYLAHVVAAFEELGRMGLGEDRGQASLLTVERYDLVQQMYQPLLANQHWYGAPTAITPDRVAAWSERLGDRVQLHFLTPTRIKHRGEWARVLDAPVLIEAVLRRLQHLSEFYGAGAWNVNLDPVYEQARAVRIMSMNTRWVEWGRTSGATGQHMQLGGIIGSVEWANVAPWLRMVLALGSFLHVGKATVFGHGWYRIA